MATVSIVKIKIRRGTDSDRRKITLDLGEIGYVTDVSSRRLFVGDGSTKGGNPVGTKFYIGDFTNNPQTFTTTQVGDLIFNTLDTRLYVLTGYDINNFPNYTNPASYAFVGTRVDEESIEYTGGAISIKVQGVQADNLNDNVIDPLRGLERISPNGPFGAKLETITGSIKFNVNGEMYVDPSVLSIGSFQSINQTIDGTSLFIENLPGAAPVDGGGNLIPNRLWVDGSGRLRVNIP